MSPYLRSTGHNEVPEAVLSEYEVTENGFLPSQEPLDHLPNPYYHRWESIASNLPNLIQSGQIRVEVQQLPILSTVKLHLETEWRRAYVVLAFITHAYIWGGNQPAEVLPPAIAVPFTEVSDHLELPPVATYAALCLWNYKPDGKSIDLNNINSLNVVNNITGTEDEAWFYLISIMVEAQGAKAIPIMMNAMQAASKRNYQVVTDALRQLQDIIKHLSLLLERMYEKCTPSVFYHEIRPRLAGSKNMAAAGLPRGVYYDLGGGKGQWMQLRGGSNAQSSLIQFFDAVLGVVHTSTGGTPPNGHHREVSFHEEMRLYMPGPHRRFLEHVAKIANIREFAMAGDSHPMQSKLLQTFQAAVQVLSDFRGIHMQMVARYIIIPSRQAAVQGRMNLAVASQAEKAKGQSLTGTGGTDLVPFLKQSREDTDRAGKGNLTEA